MPTKLKKKTKGFSPRIKKEAMRLIFDEKRPMKEVAAQIGCSVNSIQAWKKQYKVNESGASTPKKVVRPKVPQVKATTPITYEEFVRDYWSSGSKAVDALLLPPEIGPEVVRYVNEALRFAFDRLSK